MVYNIIYYVSYSLPYIRKFITYNIHIYILTFIIKRIMINELFQESYTKTAEPCDCVYKHKNNHNRACLHLIISEISVLLRDLSGVGSRNQFAVMIPAVHRFGTVNAPLTVRRQYIAVKRCQLIIYLNGSGKYINIIGRCGL